MITAISDRHQHYQHHRCRSVRSGWFRTICIALRPGFGLRMASTSIASLPALGSLYSARSCPNHARIRSEMLQSRIILCCLALFGLEAVKAQPVCYNPPARYVPASVLVKGHGAGLFGTNWKHALGEKDSRVALFGACTGSICLVAFDQRRCPVSGLNRDVATVQGSSILKLTENEMQGVPHSRVCKQT